MKNKKLVTCLLGMSLVASAVSVTADRQIGTLSHFRITPQFASTNYLTKMSNSYYVVNLDSKAPQIKVKHYLANSNGARRSDIDETWTGQRGVYTTNAQAGYIYALNLARENWWDGAFFIDGSWSPDSW